MPRRRKWTKADRQRWYERSLAGEPLVHIARSEGASYGTVQSAIYALKLASAPEAPEAHAYLCLSDEHVGIWVHPEDNNGRYEYSVETCAERYLVLEQEVARLISALAPRFRITRVHIVMLGDHIQGECPYKGAAFRLQLTKVETQIQEYLGMFVPFAKSLARVIDDRGEGPRVVVVCVPGNHGRAAPKGEGDPQTTWERVLFSMISDKLSGESNINVALPHGYHQGQVDPLSKLRIVMSHGHGELRVNYTGAPTPMTWQKWEHASRHLGLGGWDVAVAGHRHVPAYIGGEQVILTNGCFCGSNDLAVDTSLKPVPACQWFFGTWERGIAWIQNIHLSWPTPTSINPVGMVVGDMLSEDE